MSNEKRKQYDEVIPPLRDTHRVMRANNKIPEEEVGVTLTERPAYVWGTLSLNDMDIEDYRTINDLKQNASDFKIANLVEQYNIRAPGARKLDMHFVAVHAVERGYEMYRDEIGQIKFRKATS